MLPIRFTTGFPYDINLDGIPLIAKHLLYGPSVNEWLDTRKVRIRLIAQMIIACYDTDMDIRMTAAFILGAVKDNRADTVLLRLLQDSNENLRAIAAWALGNIPSEKVYEELCQFVKSELYPPALQFAMNSLANVELFLALSENTEETS